MLAAIAIIGIVITPGFLDPERSVDQPDQLENAVVVTLDQLPITSG